MKLHQHCEAKISKPLFNIRKPTLKPNCSNSMLHLNVRSINKHLEELELLIEELESPPLCVCLSETWLNAGSPNEIYKHKGYSGIIAKPRDKKPGGGVMIQLREDVQLVKELETPFQEALCVKICHCTKNYIVVLIYNAPDFNKLTFVETLEEYLDSLETTHPIIVTGDFNIDVISNNRLSQLYLDVINSNGFDFLSSDYTRVGTTSKTCLDHFFTRNFPSERVETLCKSITDHFPILLFASDTKPNVLKEPRINYKFLNNPSKVVEFNAKVEENLSNSDNALDVNGLFENFSSALNIGLNEFCTFSYNKRSIKNPWITNSLKNMSKKRDRLYKKAINNPQDEQAVLQFKVCKRNFEKELRNSKRKYYQQRFFKSLGDSKQTFQTLNEVLGKKSSDKGNIAAIAENDREITNAKEIAESMNTYFIDVGEKLAKNIPIVASASSVPYNEFSMYLFPANDAEIVKIVQNLKAKTSSGFDRIPNTVIKVFNPSILEHLTCIINHSFKTGTFPDAMKISKVIPLFKGGNRSDPSCYRPISLPISLSKVLEKAMYLRVCSFLERFGLLFRNQFGFRSRRCTIDAIAKISEKIRFAESNASCCAIFLDLKKAFDTIDHDILLQKLDQIGIRGKANDWFRSYLNNRSQYVEVNQVTSHKKQVKCGVPQGSILGPLLFLIYINDLPNVCKYFEPFLFADDANLLHISTSENSQSNIQGDFRNVVTWTNANRVSLNVPKTYYLDIKNCSLQLEVNNELISQETVVKYLGIYVDNCLNYKSHINNLKTRLSVHTGVIFKLRQFLPKHLLLLYYNSHIKPIIQYGVLVYGCTTYNNLMPIFLQQKKIIRLILRKRKSESVYDDFFRLKILSVFELHAYDLLKFTLRCVNKQHSDQDMNELFVRKTVNRSTRSSNKGYLVIPNCRNNLQRHSIQCRGAKLVNFLLRNDILNSEYDKLSENEIQILIHKFRDTIILQNEVLIKTIF